MRFFLLPAPELLRLDAAVFFVDGFAAGFAADLAGDLLVVLAGATGPVAFAARCLAGACFVRDFFAPDSTDDVDGCDWATADGKKPSEKLKRIPANTATAKRRTQSLPTVES